MAKDLFVGVDVGGTKVAAGLVNAKGEISAQVRVAMVCDASPQRGLDSVVSAIAHVLPPDTKSIAGIGICAPGPLDPNAGVVLNPPNVPCWRDFPLAAAVRKKYSVPVRIDNDANAAALAETRWGAGRGYNNVFYVTIGTGIGTGIVFNGKIYHGRTGSAGEGGHVSVNYNGPICGCGKPGCVEVYASGTAIAKRAQREVSEGNRSAMLEMAHGDVSAINGIIVGKAVDVGDAVAKKIMDETVEIVSVWLSNIVDLLDPEVIVIGGGAAALYGPYLGKLGQRIPELAVNPKAKEIPIVSARYGADSGIAGGAALCA